MIECCFKCYYRLFLFRITHLLHHLIQKFTSWLFSKSTFYCFCLRYLEDTMRKIINFTNHRLEPTKLTQKHLPWRAVSEGGGFWRKKEKLGKNSSSCMLMLEKRGKRISFAACPQRPLWDDIIYKVSFKSLLYVRHYNLLSFINNKF